MFWEISDKNFRAPHSRCLQSCSVAWHSMIVLRNLQNLVKHWKLWAFEAWVKKTVEYEASDGRRPGRGLHASHTVGLFRLLNFGLLTLDCLDIGWLSCTWWIAQCCMHTECHECHCMQYSSMPSMPSMPWEHCLLWPWATKCLDTGDCMIQTSTLSPSWSLKQPWLTERERSFLLALLPLRSKEKRISASLCNLKHAKRKS